MNIDSDLDNIKWRGYSKLSCKKLRYNYNEKKCTAHKTFFIITANVRLYLGGKKRELLLI